MTRTGSVTFWPHWSSQIKRAANWFYGQNDLHLSLQSNLTDFYGALGWSGMQGSIPAGVVITSATMYMRITAGVHVARVGSNPTITCISAVTSIPALNGSHANDGGTLTQGAALNLGGASSGSALGGNTQGSTQAIDVRAYIHRIAPGSTTVNGYGAGQWQTDFGCILVCNSWTWATEIWSAADARKPYIVINYEYANVAPYTPTVGSISNATHYALGDRYVSINNPGDVDGDAVGPHIEWGAASGYGVAPGSWNHVEAWGYTIPSGSLSRGQWYGVRGRLHDEHGAYGSYSGTVWFYVNRLPNNPSII